MIQKSISFTNLQQLTSSYRSLAHSVVAKEENTSTVCMYLRISREILDKIQPIFCKFDLYAGHKNIFKTSPNLLEQLRNLFCYNMSCFIICIFWSIFGKYFFNSTNTRIDSYTIVYGTCNVHPNKMQLETSFSQKWCWWQLKSTESPRSMLFFIRDIIHINSKIGQLSNF